jgi:hypothetical protein
VHVVVNHLRFAAPVSEATLEQLRGWMPVMRDAGGLGAYVVQPEPDHLILVLRFESEEQANDLAQRVGGPLMREHIVPLLASPTERSLGPVVAQFDA